MWRTLATVLVLVLMVAALEVSCRLAKAKARVAPEAATDASKDASKERSDPDEYWEKTPVIRFCRNPSCSACAAKRRALDEGTGLGDVGPDDHDDPAFI